MPFATVSSSECEADESEIQPLIRPRDVGFCASGFRIFPPWVSLIGIGRPLSPMTMEPPRAGGRGSFVHTLYDDDRI